LKQNTQDFIKKAQIVHGNTYDYSDTIYVSRHSKLSIRCLKHGIFEQEAGSHLDGCGCPSCGGRPYTDTKKFIEKAKLIHGDLFDYSSVNYTNCEKKIQIICSNHGIFEQRPQDHLNGRGCPKCAGKNRTTSSFIKESQLIHMNLYDYSKTIYTGIKEKVNIICSKHGVFEQTAEKHLIGHGCPKCNSSKGELQIKNYLDQRNFKYIQQKSFEGCRYKLELYFDFYLPDYNLCIEFQGEQHYKPIKRWGGLKKLEITQIRDSIKREFCINNNIHLLEIKYTEDLITILNNRLTNYNIGL
jgi:Zn finger protein HypA/HybF involved in hydrogenase expression